LKTRLLSTDIDRIETEAVVLPFFSDERPLKGAAGLIDWRMRGKISKLISEGRISGAKGESTLILPDYRISAKKILMTGLGDSSRFNEMELKEAGSKIIQQITHINVKEFTVALPPKKLSSLESTDATGALIRGIVASLEKENVKDSNIFATIALEKADLDKTQNYMKKLRKEVRGVEESE